MVLVNFWRYPDPYQRFLIRIRIRPNDTDPTGSETLMLTVKSETVLASTLREKDVTDLKRLNSVDFLMALYDHYQYIFYYNS